MLVERICLFLQLPPDEFNLYMQWLELVMYTSYKLFNPYYLCQILLNPIKDCLEKLLGMILADSCSINIFKMHLTSLSVL